MSAARHVAEQNASKRQRELVTPEGIVLPISRASRGARLIALVLDYLIILVALIALAYGIYATGSALGDLAEPSKQAGEFLTVVFFLTLFVIWNGYFIFFEMGPRGATPGKRMMKIRVASRDGGRLTPEAVIARNLLRQIEIFLPLSFLSAAGGDQASAGALAAAVWFLIFMFFPFFNRDALRAGDIIAGTWVLDAPRIGLAAAMSVADGSENVSARFAFADGDLSVYGEHELKTLEDILRRGDPQAMATVQQAICTKIGWEAGAGYEREFLETFYQALRAKLEGDMRFGKRKMSKDDAA